MNAVEEMFNVVDDKLYLRYNEDKAIGVVVPMYESFGLFGPNLTSGWIDSDVMAQWPSSLLTNLPVGDMYGPTSLVHGNLTYQLNVLKSLDGLFQAFSAATKSFGHMEYKTQDHVQIHAYGKAYDIFAKPHQAYHFQPTGVLYPNGSEGHDKRYWNDNLLGLGMALADTGAPVLYNRDMIIARCGEYDVHIAQ